MDISIFGIGTVAVSYTHLLFHISVELTVQDIPGGIVNQTGKVGLCGFPSQIEDKAILNIALPQIVPVSALESLRCV